MKKETTIRPTSIVVFGATGDLSRKKLIPSLFDLYQKGFLPVAFKIIGVSRKELSHEEYQEIVKTILSEKGRVSDTKKLEEFSSHFLYVQGLFDSKEGYKRLVHALAKEDVAFGACANKLFYLAVPPLHYKTIFENLAESELTVACSDETGWTRILVEKPFGNDIATAQELDQILGKLFNEKQIFRIDHYLAKEVLQDILMFRFSNLLFEPIWNKNYIERVEIKLLEQGDTDTRASFYDSVGALRDVGQNHILQMLAFVAMEDPVELEPARIRDARANVLQSLRPLTPQLLDEACVRGQYKGYQDLPATAPQSQTETYFRMNVFIDNDRWQGIPFRLESGKALREDRTEIKIYFKKTESCLCPPEAEHHHQNILTFKIQPNEGISILFWAKKPGLTLDLEPKELSFAYRNSPDTMMLADAYEKVLFDGITGDQTLFTSTAEVSAAWNFITPILELWKELPLYRYKKGSAGPAEVIDALTRHE